MIFVDLHGNAPPAKWLAKADKLKKELLSAKTNLSRRKIIDNNAALWQDDELKEWLRGLSHRKCWYSEARDCCNYWHVDHFRPKNEIKDLAGNIYEGYWWLAFCWENYRFSGAISNVVKSSHFPVLDDVWCCDPNDDLDDEEPYLLDPTDPIDPGLISFSSDGIPRPIAGIDGWNRTRVKESIKTLMLRHKYLVDARKDIWQECERKVNRAREQMKRHELKKHGAKGRLRDALEDLKILVADEAPFSSVARACVNSHGLKWLNKALNIG